MARAADLGANDRVLFTRTHLGNVLHPGDTALGYDLTSANFASGELDPGRNLTLPDVVLVGSLEASPEFLGMKKELFRRILVGMFQGLLL